MQVQLNFRPDQTQLFPMAGSFQRPEANHENRKVWFFVLPALFLVAFLILVIEIPFGITIALSMPRKGFWGPVVLSQ